MGRAKFFRVIVGIGFVAMLAWVVMAIVDGLYIEAVTISSVASVLAWFALGAGKLGN